MNEKTTWPIAKLHNWEQNPRSINKDDFARLKKQIQKLGVYKPLLITEDGTVLGGNMRLRAYRELGITDVWVSVVDAPDDTKKLEYALSDNDRAGTYDEQALAELVTNTPDIDLGDYKVDLGEPVDLQALLDKFGPTPEIEEDEAPEPPVEATSKLGEVYQLGRHRLMCGSATSIEDVERLMDGAKADLYHTDPPYNVDYTGKTKDALKIDNDKMDDGTFRQFLYDSFSAAVSVMKRGGSFYIFHADSEGYNFRGAATDSGMLIKQCLTWVKNTMVMGRQDYQWKHEPILYGWVDGGSHNWYADRKQTTVINFDKPLRNGEHPTMKPVGLCAYLIGNSTKTDDIVLDTFGGSGSTLIACEQTNRTCYMMELDPRYVDVIRQRWAKFVYPDRWEQEWEQLTPIIKESHVEAIAA